MQGVTILFPRNLAPSEQAVTLLINAAAHINALWYLAEWEQGRDPPCCPKCAEVRYRPDRITNAIIIDLAPVMVGKGTGSCQSVAAMHCGHEIAEAVRDGASCGSATDEHYIVLEPQSQDYYHAVCMGPNGRHDATAEMKR